MGRRLFLGTLGFHETFIASTLHEMGARQGDGLLVVTLSPIVAGVEIALNNLRALALKLGLRMHGHVEIDPVEPLQSMEKLWGTVSDLITGNGYTWIIADITGGSRIVIVSTLLTLILASGKVPIRIRVYNETGGSGALQIDLAPLRAALRGLGMKGRILRLVAERPGVTQAELARDLEISEKTVANYVSELSRQGLVARKGRKRGLYLTGLGRLLARLV